MAEKLLIPIPAVHRGAKVWEEVGDRLERAPAPGGYLYRTSMTNPDGSAAVALAFVPVVDTAEQAPAKVARKK